MTSHARHWRGIAGLYAALWHFSAGARSTLMGALACLLGAQLVLLGVPYVAGRAINVLQLQGWAGALMASQWLLAIVGITLLHWLMHGPGRFLERNVALRLRQRMSAELIERLVKLPLDWHETQHSGATAHRVQQSVNALAGFAENQFIYLSSLVRLVGPLVALWFIEPWVSFAALLGLLIIGTSLRRFDRRMIALAHDENSAERRYAATLLDSLSNITTLFALRQSRAVVALLQRRLGDIFTPVKRSIVINEFKWFTVDMTSRILSCALVVLFAWRASRGNPGGTLLLGSIYMVWEYSQQAGGVVTAIASHFQTFARLQADYASADVIRDTPPAAHLLDDATNTSNELGEWRRLQLHGLRFTHPASRQASHQQEATLRTATLILQRGRRYALIGPSGAGKSTLLRVLAGLYAADTVTLQADNTQFTDAANVARRLRHAATLLPQDAEVFEGTLAENLTLCETQVGPPAERDYLPALAVAQATEFLPTATTGLQMRVAERGANWSGGQRARIALARGVLAARDSSLLLLDEPTASLDGRTEARVYEQVFAAFPQACIVSSVHRMNLLPRFDEIIFMQSGSVVAQGTHAELELHCMEFRQLLNTVQSETH